MKHELQNIISGKSRIGHKNIIESTLHYLTSSQGSSKQIETASFAKIKEKEQNLLTDFITANNLWVTPPNDKNFIAEGAEQQVYLDKDEKYVLKTNDAIFYKSWIDYFHSLLLHNYFFSDTSYELIGFIIKEDKLFAVVRQPFVVTTSQVSFEEIKNHMEANGFSHKRNNDYFSSSLGIILEDLHDENVLIQNDVLFFIDTVFYLTPHFFSND